MALDLAVQHKLQVTKREYQTFPLYSLSLVRSLILEFSRVNSDNQKEFENLAVHTFAAIVESPPEDEKDIERYIDRHRNGLSVSFGKVNDSIAQHPLLRRAVLLFTKILDSSTQTSMGKQCMEIDVKDSNCDDDVDFDPDDLSVYESDSNFDAGGDEPNEYEMLTRVLSEWSSANPGKIEVKSGREYHLSRTNDSSCRKIDSVIYNRTQHHGCFKEVAALMEGKMNSTQYPQACAQLRSYDERLKMLDDEYEQRRADGKVKLFVVTPSKPADVDVRLGRELGVEPWWPGCLPPAF